MSFEQTENAFVCLRDVYTRAYQCDDKHTESECTCIYNLSDLELSIGRLRLRKTSIDLIRSSFWEMYYESSNNT